MLADKDIDKVVQLLSQADLPISEWFIAPIDYPRAATTAQLEETLARYVTKKDIKQYASLADATQAAIEASQPQDLILVCGSFHTIAEALNALA